MVQVITPTRQKPPSFMQSVMGGLAEATPAAIEKYQGLKRQQQENQAISDYLGPESRGMPREFQQMMLQGDIQRKNKSAELQKGNIEELQRYNDIKKYFGEEAAEIYRAAPEGGKTAIIQSLLENAQRGTNLKDLLPQNETQEIGVEQPEIVSMKTKDYDKGLTPKERTARQNERYKINLPLYEEANQKIGALESEKDHLDILEELSPQISFAERLNMNPKTGELFIPGLASREAQRFVKTINDFTVSAKDSYGSRVTNFDLQQFMKRLPTLANSEEGRKEIIKQMKIINDINYTRQKEIQNVIDEHGGIRNIDYDEAQRLAEKRTKSKVDSLKKQFTSSDKFMDADYRSQLKKFKSNVPKGNVAVIRSDGTVGYIPKENLSKFLKDKAGETL